MFRRGHPLRNRVKRCYVIDGRGNVGVATTYFIGGGTPNAHIGVNCNQTEGNSIYDLEGVAWDVGGGSIELFGLGVDIQDGDWNGSISKSLFNSLLINILLIYQNAAYIFAFE